MTEIRYVFVDAMMILYHGRRKLFATIISLTFLTRRSERVSHFLPIEPGTI